MKKILKEDFLDVVPEDELINKEVDDELSSDDEPKQQSPEKDSLYDWGATTEIQFQYAESSYRKISYIDKDNYTLRIFSAIRRLLELSDAVEAYAFKTIYTAQSGMYQFQTAHVSWLDGVDVRPAAVSLGGGFTSVYIDVRFVNDTRKVWNFIRGLCNISYSTRDISTEENDYRWRRLDICKLDKGVHAVLNTDEVDAVAKGNRMIPRDKTLRIIQNCGIKSLRSTYGEQVDRIMYNNIQRKNGKLQLGLQVQYRPKPSSMETIIQPVTLEAKDAFQMCFRMRLLSKLCDNMNVFNENTNRYSDYYRHVGWCQDVHDEWGQAMFSMQVGLKKMGLKYYDAECAVDNYIDTIYKDVEKQVNKNIDDVDCKGDMEAQLRIMVKTVNQWPDMDY